jgi:phospholipid/cholesterol/gamma-HCH transport system substrate-binding protein
MSFLQAVEFKVGAMVVAVGAIIAGMSMQVSDNPSFFKRNQKAWFLIPSASGLIKNSAVKSAGIAVGTIKNISLQDGKARIDIAISSDVPLTSSAAIEIRSNGILGDRYVEVYPGAMSDPRLGDGEQILIVKERGSLDSVMSSVGEVTDSLKDVAVSLKEAVSEDGTRKHVLGRIVKNIEILTQDLSEMTSANKDKISDIIDQVHDITATLDELVNDESEKGFKHTWKNAMTRIDSSLKNIDEITGKVNRGEGTIGKLINDESTVEELNSAIVGVNSIFDSANRVQLGIDVSGSYLNSVGAAKSLIAVRIQPGLDRFYELGIVDDPAGVIEKQRVRDTVGTTISEVNTERTYFNKTKFTLLYAKNYWDWTIKGGLIENSAGVGLDYNLWKQKIAFSVEAFGLSKANLRASARIKLTHGLYLTGGISDALDKNDSRSGYFGAGLYLTNDDLKLLLSGSSFL